MKVPRRVCAFNFMGYDKYAGMEILNGCKRTPGWRNSFCEEHAELFYYDSLKNLRLQPTTAAIRAITKYLPDGCYFVEKILAVEQRTYVSSTLGR